MVKLVSQQIGAHFNDRSVTHVVFAITGAQSVPGGIAKSNLNVMQALAELITERGGKLTILSLLESDKIDHRFYRGRSLSDRSGEIRNSLPCICCAPHRETHCSVLITLVFRYLCCPWPLRAWLARLSSIMVQNLGNEFSD